MGVSSGACDAAAGGLGYDCAAGANAAGEAETCAARAAAAAVAARAAPTAAAGMASAALATAPDISATCPLDTGGAEEGTDGDADDEAYEAVAASGVAAVWETGEEE